MGLFRKFAKYGRAPVGAAYRLFVLPLGIGKIYRYSQKSDEPAGSPPSPSPISIDVANITGEINRYLFGGFETVLLIQQKQT